MENIKDMDIIEEAILDVKRLTKLAEEAGKEFSAQNLKKEAEALVAETLVNEEEEEVISEEEIEKIFAEMESEDELEVIKEEETVQDVMGIVDDIMGFAKANKGKIDEDSFEVIEEFSIAMKGSDLGNPLRPIAELKNIASIIKKGLGEGKNLMDIGREYSKKDAIDNVEAIRELFTPFFNVDMQPAPEAQTNAEPVVKKRTNNFLSKVKSVLKGLVSEEDEIDALLNDLEAMNEKEEEHLQETDEALLRKIEKSLSDSERRLAEMKKLQEAINALKSDDVQKAKEAMDYIKSLPPMTESDAEMTKEEALKKAYEYIEEMKRNVNKLESEFNKTKGEAMKAVNDMNEEEMLDEYSVEELDEMLKELEESEHSEQLDEADLAAKQKEMEDKIKKNHEEAKQRLANMEKMVAAAKSMKEEEMPFGESEEMEIDEAYMKEVEDAVAEFDSMEESLAHTQTHANAKKTGSHNNTNYGKEERLRPAMKESKLAVANKELKKSLQESKELNEKYANALQTMREKINEMASYTANLVNINKLFMEASTTKDEKLQIAERFKNVKTVEASKALYESIKVELTKGSVKEGVDKKVNTKVTVSNNGTVLKESNTSFKDRFKHLVEYQPQG